ncbi:amino acid ABC transporter substrate-binding protein, PAAT family [Andreprevotia lacus DSM 23236]|jgi:polar amino acid transport system substrate-binding protein|uniref:Amino acid ABC transporter substrate-binding protein, PAAT family n=1 Tax=Andreprevotia lacus DSM 23236 TaxID=1121001 RepID=A0A1W1X326_9NEIS|nr:hypothetical protein [Andreprevotia lacus]SMC18379.1 amino acid ABC transporter substrate-binding protein, PAAT family [Andreprevotia lacus DSM 23236]
MACLLRICALLLLLVFAPAQAAVRQIVLYNYYDAPPFVTVPGQGLTYVLADQLNRLGSGRFHFEVVVMPRRRLDLEVVRAESGWVVPWANPLWFGDASRQRYRWTPAVLRDTDWWLSRRDKPLQLSQLKEGGSLQFGGLLGHRYPDLADAIDSEHIKRYDAADYGSSLRMLLAGRVDFITMPASVTVWMRREYGAQFPRLLLQPRNQSYERCLFSPNGDAELADFLAQSVQQLAGNADWQRELRAYQSRDPVQ